MGHIPVMVEEVLRYLLHDGSRWIVDATAGGGGHMRAVLQERPLLRVIGIDRDSAAIQSASASLEEFGDRVTLVTGNFRDLPHLLGDRKKVDGIFADLGFSSLQLDGEERGFSYTKKGPLDMRMGGSRKTAAALIADSTVEQLASILGTYGEVRRAMRIARAIKRASDAGRMNTTADLRTAVDEALGSRSEPSVLSQVFQAIRICVNEELESLDAFLHGATQCLEHDGRLVVISYHSLEDRRVKNFMRNESTDCLCPPGLPVCRCGHHAVLEMLTRRVITPSNEEITRNVRARSARLRAAKFL